MLSNTGRLPLEHVRIARRDFGLPDDFEFSVILKYPEFFRLFDAKESRSKYIEVVDRDKKLASHDYPWSIYKISPGVEEGNP